MSKSNTIPRGRLGGVYCLVGGVNVFTCGTTTPPEDIAKTKHMEHATMGAV